MSPLKLTMY